MQKSKKMMVSLCGLALSSLFIVSNKSTVHADSVSDAQNNAITWDSDNDDSQVVSDTQTKIEQAMPQEAAAHQQNTTQTVQNNAETSTVRSSSAAPRTTNQNTAVQSPKISNINDAQAAVPVVINNPANNKVRVHYVDSNGNAVDNSSYDYDIDATKTGQGSYTVPKDYNLNNPDGKYNISVKNVGTSIYADSGLQNNTDVKMSSDAVCELAKAFNITNYSSDADAAAKIEEELDKDNRILMYAYRDIPAEPIATPAFYTLVDDLHDPNWGTMYSKTAKIIIRDARKSPALWNFLKKARLNDSRFDAWSIDFQTEYDHTFSDNSGNVKSVNGNTVNVVLTKPQSVNPAMDTRCQSQATRTIQINFPDGQVPKSYDGIVDKSGKLVQTVHFTRTATEDALTGDILQYGSWTSDNQDHNFIGFPERTLPRIPGYTLSIKPF